MALVLVSPMVSVSLKGLALVMAMLKVKQMHLVKELVSALVSPPQEPLRRHLKVLVLMAPNK